MWANCFFNIKDFINSFIYCSTLMVVVLLLLLMMMMVVDADCSEDYDYRRGGCRPLTLRDIPHFCLFRARRTASS